MTFEDIQKAFFESKAAILDESDLVYVKAETFREQEWLFYHCPCGLDHKHLAMRVVFQEGLSKVRADVLNCFKNNLQWLIRPVNVAGVIEQEEKQYLSLLKRAPAIIKKVLAKRALNEETIAFLKDTHGIDKEMVDFYFQGGNLCSAPSSS